MVKETFRNWTFSASGCRSCYSSTEETPKPKVKKSDTKTEKVTKASLSKLTKQGLEDFAKEKYGVDVDRRKKKDDLVKEVLALSKKA